ncbi:Chitin synthesis regulation, Congo red resistance, RCR protein [Pochonia chlamydosporia 170]|uniref:Chitin synthesis regulation, Congo red resistance, RCR protein n=1 Tax=Pochonia chlamydosporia 170 TaxID=1380566 RepID=A0A179G2W1_METCM|nr:Chitin synthesis regulation, Congo red resistance, RCR protein [Pochonia chlamydosporia 170]OAQ72196.1 Chitin synthesis regulation, Congo red resistance, RCR protein [Pochonia chlamydosporia 170]
MAPTSSSVASTGSSALNLIKRYYYYCDGYSYSYRCSSRWYDWGRWVVLGGVIFIVLLVLLTCACTARRRRRRGAQPMYGTGWMAPVGKHDQNQQHQMNNYNQGYQPEYNQNQGYNQPQGYYNTPPPYGQQQVPQSTGTTFNPNDGYYGNAQYGVQPPAQAYQRDGGYAPPAGPPPGK